MKITDENWQVQAESIEHKQFLFAYARERGVLCAPAFYGFETDADLWLNYWNDKMGLGSLPVKHREERAAATVILTVSQFRQLCDNHALTVTAPLSTAH